MIKKIAYCMALTATLLCGCSSGNADKTQKLSVSIEPQRKILEQLVGDRFQVVTVLGNGANPETYDPSVAQRMSTNESAAYFVTGYLPFESTIASSLTDATKVVDTSVGINPVTGTHSHRDGDDDHAHDTDPHVWTSIRNAKIIADNMTQALTEIDPDYADLYRQRNAALQQSLDSLDQATAAKLAQAGAHAFVVWHPSLSYYARDYGLHQIAVGQESKELSIGSLKAIIDEARADSVKVFFFQKEYDSRQAQSLNKEIGSTLVTINPMSYDWDTEIINITDQLTK